MGWDPNPSVSVFSNICPDEVSTQVLEEGRKLIDEWNDTNNDQYTLRGWAWHKDDDGGNVMVAGNNDREYKWGLETSVLGGKGMHGGAWMEDDYEAMKEGYRGKTPKWGPKAKGDQKNCF
ncbi:hypothetical protein DFP73DRAFT_523185 [Morchella snyderi]|nr:hypothetical protein DFP73DRAFT_523185 [Morchella snyderi]